jgi:ribonuclease-3
MVYHEETSKYSRNKVVRTISVEELLGYFFFDTSLLDRALTRKAYANEQRQRNTPCEDQEVLATLGDAVLKTILIDLLIRFGYTTPDTVTQEKKALEREELLAKVAMELEVGSFIRLGIGEQRQKAQEQPYVLAETLEALIGAIFLDGGYEAAEQRIKHWFDRYLP